MTSELLSDEQIDQLLVDAEARLRGKAAQVSSRIKADDLSLETTEPKKKTKITYALGTYSQLTVLISISDYPNCTMASIEPAISKMTTVLPRQTLKHWSEQTKRSYQSSQKHLKNLEGREKWYVIHCARNRSITWRKISQIFSLTQISSSFWPALPPWEVFNHSYSDFPISLCGVLLIWYEN